jgi:hypothetical protein
MIRSVRNENEKWIIHGWCDYVKKNKYLNNNHRAIVVVLQKMTGFDQFS